MGKSTISMAIFNSFLYVYQRVLQATLRSSTFTGKLKWESDLWFTSGSPALADLYLQHLKVNWDHPRKEWKEETIVETTIISGRFLPMFVGHVQKTLVSHPPFYCSLTCPVTVNKSPISSAWSNPTWFRRLDILWLVVYLLLWKIWVRQLGLVFPLIYGK